MGFMYLQMRADGEGKIHAKVTTHGALEFSSLGGPNSRVSDRPFVVFQIEGFDGLANIRDEDIMAEVMRRFTTKELSGRLALELSDKELIDVISDRLRAT